MFFRKLRVPLVLALSILVIALASVLFLNTLVKIPSVQSYLLTRISRAIGYELHASTMSVSLGRGIGISARGLEAKSLAGPEKIVASRIRVTLDTKELLRGRIVPTRVFLYQPQIQLATEKDVGAFKAGEEAGLKEILAKKLPRLVAVSMEEGRISLRNTPFELRNLDFNISKESDDPLIHQVYLRGKVRFRKEEAPLTLRGTITQDIRKKNDFLAEVTLKTGKIPLRWVPWPRSLNVGKGHATLSVKLKGSLGGSLSALGKIDLDDLHFSLARQERGKTFSFPHLALDFASVYARPALEISNLRIKAPDFLLTVRSSVDLRDTSNPRLVLDVESPYMPLKAFKGIFPTPILPSWFEKRLFPLLTEGEVRVNRFSMNGTLRQLRNLALPENSGSLSLKVAWKNLEVLRDEAPLPFRSVSGELDIKNGALLLSGLKARFGKSEVKAASLEVRNLFGGHAGYEVLVDGFYDLGDLLKQADMGLIPAKLRAELHGFESASGNLKASVSAVYEKNKGFPQIRKGEFSFKDCTVIHPELFFPLLVGDGQIQVDGKGRGRFQGTGLWGNSIFDAAGSVENAFQTVKAEIVAQGDMDGIVDRFLHGKSPLVRFGDLVPCRVTLAKEEKTWFFQGGIDPKNLLLETGLFSMSPRGKGNKIRFSIDFQPGERINFRKLNCLFGSSPLEVSGSYDLKGKDLSHFRVASPGLLLEDLGIQAKNLISRTKGLLIFDTKVRLSRQNPLMTSVKGKVETRDVSFMVSGLPSIFHGCFSQLTFDKKEIFIHLLKIKAGESALHINGKLNGWDGLKGRLTMNADYLNAPDFIPVRGKPSKGVKGRDLPRFLRKTDVEMKLNAARGRWGSIEYGPLNAEGAFRSGDFHIYHSELQMDQGVLSAKGHVKRAKEP
ncbi:MAG TPA: hypothetical protein VMW90_01120, partial [Acidobacteriota bacterium]|nr:hypothetical protein [Acidobacteriota bacterium]